MQDEFLPYGLSELLNEAVAAIGDAVLRQIPQFLGAQRLLGSPAHLCTELKQAVHLAIFGAAAAALFSSRRRRFSLVFHVFSWLFHGVEGPLKPRTPRFMQLFALALDRRDPHGASRLAGVGGGHLYDRGEVTWGLRWSFLCRTPRFKARI